MLDPDEVKRHDRRNFRLGAALGRAVVLDLLDELVITLLLVTLFLLGRGVDLLVRIILCFEVSALAQLELGKELLLFLRHSFLLEHVFNPDAEALFARGRGGDLWQSGRVGLTLEAAHPGGWSDGQEQADFGMLSLSCVGRVQRRVEVACKHVQWLLDARCASDRLVDEHGHPTGHVEGLLGADELAGLGTLSEWAPDSEATFDGGLKVQLALWSAVLVGLGEFLGQLGSNYILLLFDPDSKEKLFTLFELVGLLSQLLIVDSLQDLLVLLDVSGELGVLLLAERIQIIVLKPREVVLFFAKALLDLLIVLAVVGDVDELTKLFVLDLQLLEGLVSVGLEDLLLLRSQLHDVIHYLQFLPQFSHSFERIITLLFQLDELLAVGLQEGIVALLLVELELQLLVLPD